MNKLNGIYLVIDPSQNWEDLFLKTQQALEGGVKILQIWDHWKKEISREEKKTFCSEIKKLATSFHVPVILNEDWELANETNLDGLHLDQIPTNFDKIREALKGKIVGLTVSNQEDLIIWAEKNQLSYISFCSISPSNSVDTCELVKPESIKKARKLTSLPIFLSGGISLENLEKLNRFTYDGIAVISGILSANDPKIATQDYLKKSKTLA